MLKELENDQMQVLPGSHETKVQKAGLPGWTIDDIQTALRRYNRTPFQDLLGEWMTHAPRGSEIATWARKYPDRYAGALAQLGKIAGFSERREVLTGHMTPANMSDSQLEDKFHEMARVLNIDGDTLIHAITQIMNEKEAPKSIQLTATDVQADDSAPEEKPPD